MSIIQVLDFYSDEQPRDERGRWGDGSDSPGESPALYAKAQEWAKQFPPESTVFRGMHRDDLERVRAEGAITSARGDVYVSKIPSLAYVNDNKVLVAIHAADSDLKEPRPGQTSHDRLLTAPSAKILGVFDPNDHAIKASGTIELGESAGHPFRGNQWKSGEGEDRAPAAKAAPSISERYPIETAPASVDPRSTEDDRERDIDRYLNQGSSFPEDGTQYAQELKGGVARDISARMADIPIGDMARASDNWKVKECANELGRHDVVFYLRDGVLGRRVFEHPGQDENEVRPEQVDAWRDATIEQYSAPGMSAAAGDDPRAEGLIREAAASFLIQSWAETSNDSEPRALALQERAAEVFGIKDPPQWTATSDIIGEKTSVFAETNKDTLDAFLRAQYDSTQASLKDAGITELMLFRGEAREEAPSSRVTDFSTFRPLSAWSASHDTADNFTEHGFTTERSVETVSVAWVPAERVLSSPRTGFGCYDEKEFVLIGGRGEVSTYVKRGFGASAAVELGESAGHPFRGNQWKSGEGEDKAGKDPWLAEPKHQTDPDHFITKAFWGASHDISKQITGEAAHILGISGYERSLISYTGPTGHSAEILGIPEADQHAKPDPDAERIAREFLNEIHDAPPTDFHLYSGHVLPEGTPPLQVGDRFAVPLMATSTDPDTARTFSGPVNTPFDRGEWPAALFEVAPGAQAVKFSGMERITSGLFEVTGIGTTTSENPDKERGVPVVNIKQIRTFDPDNPHAFTAALVEEFGEGEGHPFRGNQWKSGESGGETKTVAERIGPEPELKEGHYDSWREKKTAWEHEVVVALSVGKLSPGEAEKLGYHNAGGGDWKPLPQDVTLYHVTTAKDAVLEDGLKTRAEAGGIGLGGGTSETISFTTDPYIAAGIEYGMNEMHEVANGTITAQDLIDSARYPNPEDAPKPFLEDMMQYHDQNWHEGDPYPIGVQATLDGMHVMYSMAPELKEYGVGITTPKSMDEVPSGWKPTFPESPIVGKDGVERYSNWNRPATPEETRDATVDLYRNFATWREQAGGRYDPLFWSPDTKAFADLDPSQIATLRYTAAPGAQGWEPGGEKEWRTGSGGAVIPQGVGLNASAVPSVVDFYSEDQPRDERGRFGGGDGLTGKNYEGLVGRKDHLTRTEEGHVPPAALANLKGVEGEQPGEHRNKQGPEWDKFVADVRENGVQRPIFITVDHGEEPKISEGNHRRDAAIEAGLESVPVEVRYFGKAEEEGTLGQRLGLQAAAVEFGESEGHPFRGNQWKSGESDAEKESAPPSAEDRIHALDRPSQITGNVDVHTTVKLDGLSDKAQSHVADAMESLAKEFPEVAARVREITTDPPPSGWQGHSGFYNGEGTVYLNPNIITFMEQRGVTGEQQVGPKAYAVDSGDARCVIEHELGHAIFGRASYQGLTDSFNQKYHDTVDPMTSRQMNAQLRTVSRYAADGANDARKDGRYNSVLNEGFAEYYAAQRLGLDDGKIGGTLRPVFDHAMDLAR